MTPHYGTGEANPGDEQCGYQDHRMCSPPVQKARDILFSPSIFVLYFNKMWVWIRHSLVKKEESLPVVKLYLLTLDSSAVMSLNGIFPPPPPPFGRLVLIRLLCMPNYAR